MTTAMVRCTQPGCDGTIQVELVDLANEIRPRTLT
jgi:hypothetical protein